MPQSQINKSTVYFLLPRLFIQRFFSYLDETYTRAMVKFMSWEWGLHKGHSANKGFLSVNKYKTETMKRYQAKKISNVGKHTNLMALQWMRNYIFLYSTEHALWLIQRALSKLTCDTMVSLKNRAINVIWKSMSASQVLTIVVHVTARSIYCMGKHYLHTLARVTETIHRNVL